MSSEQIKPMLKTTPLNADENSVVEDEEDMSLANEEEEFHIKAAKDFKNIVDNLTELKKNITVLQNQMRSLDKTVGKKLRFYNKKMKKMKRKGNRKPSGFAVPSSITHELSDFMEEEHDVKVARTNVTKFIIKYIKANQLEWEENRQIIVPNKTLKQLLRISDDSPKLTYFNLQRFMNIHFIKKDETNTQVAE